MLAVRSAKFIARENWIIAAADDTFIRVYDYNNKEKIVEFEAHKDYIRSVAVHPTLPCVISASDDNVVKLWNWRKGWACTDVFEGHTHYVMQVAFHPTDKAAFASASLDGTLRVSLLPLAENLTASCYLFITFWMIVVLNIVHKPSLNIYITKFIQMMIHLHQIVICV